MCSLNSSRLLLALIILKEQNLRYGHFYFTIRNNLVYFAKIKRGFNACFFKDLSFRHNCFLETKYCISTVIGVGGRGGSKSCHFKVAIFYLMERWVRSGRLKPLQPY